MSKQAALPKGFSASGISCGIKKSGKPDLALIYSKTPARAGCLFTNNSIPAAPILLNKDCLKKNKSFRAIIANSGNANCFMGKLGLKDARSISQDLASSLGIKKEGILVASTGIIGKRLPVGKIKDAIPQLVGKLSASGIKEAARAIMTTDTFAKEFGLKFKLGKKTISLCGIAKGAGMIAPDMATLLCFILTDANIAQGALNRALRSAVSKSFNCITVDGCMSTNDSVMLLANGQAGNTLIKDGKNLGIFTEALSLVALELAKMIVKDAEGASKFIRIEVKEARNFDQAKTAALAVANSNLFKTAVYGQNPNFGRIASAIGASGLGIKEKDLKIKLSSLKKREVNIEARLNQGKASAVVYTSDLTPEYIKINAEYN